jgi:hypothetical protein
MVRSRFFLLAALFFFLVACPLAAFGQKPAQGAALSTGRPDLSWTERVVTEEELIGLFNRNPALDLDTCREILGRLNGKEVYYIRSDIRTGTRLKVPVDFGAYLGWTPLPARVAAFAIYPRLILVVKEIPFLGWYEAGKLAGDSQACIGRDGQHTEAGFYRVLDKDEDHRSRSYPNEYGAPAWMPYSLHLYGTVYIHAGNLFGDHCSHGCVILPIGKAETLYRWAEAGTPVLVVETLDRVSRALP